MHSRHIESFNLNYRKIKPLWLTSYTTSSNKYNSFTNTIYNYNSEIKTYVYQILWFNECYQCTVWSISSKINSRHFGNMFNLRGIWRLQQPDLETKFTIILILTIIKNYCWKKRITWSKIWCDILDSNVKHQLNSVSQPLGSSQFPMLANLHFLRVW